MRARRHGGGASSAQGSSVLVNSRVVAVMAFTGLSLMVLIFNSSMVATLDSFSRDASSHLLRVTNAPPRTIPLKADHPQQQPHQAVRTPAILSGTDHRPADQQQQQQPQQHPTKLSWPVAPPVSRPTPSPTSIAPTQPAIVTPKPIVQEPPPTNETAVPLHIRLIPYPRELPLRQGPGKIARAKAISKELQRRLPPLPEPLVMPPLDSFKPVSVGNEEYVFKPLHAADAQLQLALLEAKCPRVAGTTHAPLKPPVPAQPNTERLLPSPVTGRYKALNGKRWASRPSSCSEDLTLPDAIGKREMAQWIVRQLKQLKIRCGLTVLAVGLEDSHRDVLRHFQDTYGFKGVLIEPRREAFLRLQAANEHRNDSTTVLHAAVSHAHRFLTQIDIRSGDTNIDDSPGFWEYQEGSQKRAWLAAAQAAGSSCEQVVMRTVELREVLTEFELYHIDFLMLNVPGGALDILRSLPIGTLMTVEHVFVRESPVRLTTVEYLTGLSYARTNTENTYASFSTTLFPPR